jgi:hypothetical protein
MGYDYDGAFYFLNFIFALGDARAYFFSVFFLKMGYGRAFYFYDGPWFHFLSSIFVYSKSEYTLESVSMSGRPFTR